MTGRLVIDIETRSRVDLRAAGSDVYARDPSTEVLLFGYAIDNRPAQVLDLTLDMPWPADLLRLLRDPTVRLIAFNARFERLVLSHSHVPGLPEDVRAALSAIPRWECLSHRSRVNGCPGSLDMAARFLGLGTKDRRGHALMLKLCKPGRDGSWWRPSPQQWAEFTEYCRRDVELEQYLDQVLAPLSDAELDMYHLTERLNDRGMVVDMRVVQRALVERAHEEAEAKRLFSRLVRGRFTYTQRDAMLRWLHRRGVVVPDLTKASLTEALEQELPDDVRQAIEIRLEYGRAATKKFERMAVRALRPGGESGLAPHQALLQGLFLTHAAVTGRFSSLGVQVHNLLRAAAPAEAVDAWLEGEGPRPPFAHLVRPTFVARPDHRLLISDFSAVEARGVAWLAGEEKLLNIFCSGRDVYCEAWYDLMGERITKVEHPDKRFLAKAVILGCGYMGGPAAVRRGLREQGDAFTDDQLRGFVMRYRSAYPRIPQLWRALENAAITAFTQRDTVAADLPSGVPLSFYSDGDTMLIVLPSGRVLSYHHVRWDASGQGLIYDRPNRRPKVEENMWPVAPFTGPALVENIVQGLCHDLLRCAIRAAEAHPNLVLRGHVHDELIVEAPTPWLERPQAVAEFEDQVMKAALREPWASSFPLECETAISWRYCK